MEVLDRLEMLIGECRTTTIDYSNADIEQYEFEEIAKYSK
jgi:hypothetical protein